jgi:uncharacterized cupin superfamily protein
MLHRTKMQGRRLQWSLVMNPAPICLRFRNEEVPAQASPIDRARIVEGAPDAIVRNGYSSGDGRRHAGLWDCSPGSWRVSYDEWEYCLIISGKVRLTGDDGSIVEATAGDSVVIEAGYTGLWEVLEPTRKLYVIDMGASPQP